MRRYELMLVLRPDAPDERSQAVIERATRQVVASGGQIVKVAPWGRRRLAYPIERYREGSYHIIVFEAPSDAVAELEHGLNITEEVLRHLVVRIERPIRPARRDGGAEGEEGGEDDADDFRAPSDEDQEESEDDERIDESESEAAPRAVD
jgi:small subunit ribosomal protein S6